MYISISTRIFADEPLLDVCPMLADYEFEKLDIWLDEQGEHMKPSTLIADVDRIQESLRELSRISAGSFFLAHDVDVDTFNKLSRVAKQMKVSQITIPASPLGTPFNSEIDRLKALVAAARTEGVRVSIRTEKGMLSEDPHTAVELCQSAKGLGITFDPSYFLANNQIERITDLVGPHVCHVQLRDSTPAELQVLVGLGEVDYGKLIQQLEKFNYTRALAIDLFPQLLPAEQRGLELRKLRRLLDTLL